MRNLLNGYETVKMYKILLDTQPSAEDCVVNRYQWLVFTLAGRLYLFFVCPFVTSRQTLAEFSGDVSHGRKRFSDPAQV